jgi:hypothetical protein
MAGRRVAGRKYGVGGLAVLVTLSFGVVGVPGADAASTAPEAPAAPHPFGVLTCAPYHGFRFCPGGVRPDHDLRIPSFDGVPLDADVALPASGSGPFPLIVLLHGLGESKQEFETQAPDNAPDDATLASQGFAVLMFTARGFGDSCGNPRTRTAACAQGYIHLADQRYEVRDAQYLAGRLVDEGLAKPAIAAAGVSYGAGQSLELAMLKNRMRLPDGALVPFTSPEHHVPMEVAAVFAQWPWDDLLTSLEPNGNLTTGTDTPAAADRNPVGVAKESWIKLLYGVTADNHLARPGTAPQADLTTWEHEILAGEPYRTSEQTALDIIQADKSAIGIPMAPGGPAPTALQSGWTDTLFPASEGLHYAAAVHAAGDHTPLLEVFDDEGHGWAQNKSGDTTLTDQEGLAFLDAVLLHHTQPPTGVVVAPQTCPASTPSGQAERGTSLAALETGSLALSGTAAQSVTSDGGSRAVAAQLDPAYASNLCHSLPAAREPGTADYRHTVGSAPVTLLGGVTVTAHVTVTGRDPEMVARLWDVAPGGDTRQIVAFGVLRPAVNQAAGTTSGAVARTTVHFELDPNEYTFGPGHQVDLELVGSNAPFFRASNGHFRITVSDLRADVPLGSTPAG